MVLHTTSFVPSVAGRTQEAARGTRTGYTILPDITETHPSLTSLPPLSPSLWFPFL